MNDLESKYVNIKNGIRKTIPFTGNPQNKVYILGACIAFGDRIDDNRTIASALQWRENHRDGGAKYEIINLGVLNSSIENALVIIEGLNINRGDYIFYIDSPRVADMNDFLPEEQFLYCIKKCKKICDNLESYFYWLSYPVLDQIDNKSNFEKQILKRPVKSVAAQRIYVEHLSNNGCLNTKPYMGVKNKINNTYDPSVVPINTVPLNSKKSIMKCIREGVSVIDLASIFSRPHEFVEIYTDNFHIGYLGYALIADYIFKNFLCEKKVELKNYETSYTSYIFDRIYGKDMINYLKSLEDYYDNKSKKAGAIVMNCNPFTKGHRYLIEKACDIVDRLYVFVVEEDKSEFSFNERFEMVKCGTKDLDNVSIIPSGKFVISSLSFPEYFTKEYNNSTDFDSSQDLMFFAMKIAPVLNIKMRFVGEEPIDKVTNEYNKQMKKILNHLGGVEVIEIPRLMQRSSVINATEVRKWMEEGDIKSIEKYVPKTSLEIIKKHMKLDNRKINIYAG